MLKREYPPATNDIEIPSGSSEIDQIKSLIIENKWISITPIGVYAFSAPGIGFTPSMRSGPAFNTSSYTLPVSIGNMLIIPWGKDNDYPDEIRTVLDENHLLSKIIEKKVNLFWGQGPALYRSVYLNGRKKKLFDEDSQIQSWLDSWNYKEYLQKTALEYFTLNGHFTKYYQNRGPRVDLPGSIAMLEHVSSAAVRLEWPDDSNTIQHVIFGRFDEPVEGNFIKYPVFDPTAPLLHKVSMRYSKKYEFARDNLYYNQFPFHGALPWIKLHSSISRRLLAFNANSMALKYHIEIPGRFWEIERDNFIGKCMISGTSFTESGFIKHQEKLINNFTKVLAGSDNVGKFISTTRFYDEQSGKYCSFMITPLDMNVSDFILSQMKISHEAAFQVTAAVGMHNQLSDITLKSGLSSGSELPVVYKIFLATSVDIPEEIITKDLNLAIHVNFPRTDFKLGFFHDS